MADFILIDNKIQNQYEFQLQGKGARIEYIRTSDRIFLTHTEVPKELAGKGIGSSLVRAVLEDIKKQDLTLIPMCPFVASYIKQNPEWKSLVLKGIRIK